MEARCILCPTVCQSAPDGIFDDQREARASATLSAAIMDHMDKRHQPLLKIFTAQASALFTLGALAHFKSDDGGFAASVDYMHAELKRFVNEKITPGRIPPRDEVRPVKTVDSWDELKWPS